MEKLDWALLAVFLIGGIGFGIGIFYNKSNERNIRNIRKDVFYLYLYCCVLSYGYWSIVKMMRKFAESTVSLFPIIEKLTILATQKTTASSIKLSEILNEISHLRDSQTLMLQQQTNFITMGSIIIGAFVTLTAMVLGLLTLKKK